MAKKYIVLHHSAGVDGVTRDFDAMKKYHMEHNGWRNIGYHWVVERVNGVLTAIPGRAESDTGAHCPGRNTDGIGVCLVGDFTNAPPDEEQYAFVANLCRNIIARHPIKEIGGHRDYMATACPGNMYDVNHVKELVYRTDTEEESEDEMVRYAKLSDIPNEWGFRDVIEILMDAKIINGDGSDKAGNNDIIDLSHDQVRSLIFEYRGGAFDRKLIAEGLEPAVKE